MRDVSCISVKEQQHLGGSPRDEPAVQCHSVSSLDRDILIVHANIGRCHGQGSPWYFWKVEHATLHEIHDYDEQNVTGGDD